MCGKGKELHGGDTAHKNLYWKGGDTAHTFLISGTNGVGTPHNIERKHILGAGTPHILCFGGDTAQHLQQKLNSGGWGWVGDGWLVQARE